SRARPLPDCRRRRRARAVHGRHRVADHRRSRVRGHRCALRSDHGRRAGAPAGDRRGIDRDRAGSRRRPVSARTIAVLVPTTSRGRRRRGVDDTDLLRVLLPSLLATATWDGSVTYRLSAGYDAADPCFDDPRTAAALEAAVRRHVGDRPLTLVPRRCEGTAHAPVAVWNRLFADAYADGCDFFYQLGDDLSLETAGWARDFPAALLLNRAEPGLGVTGPVDRGHVTDAGRPVIAFSLWGDKPLYTVGALRNAELACTLYPGWTCRFYVGASVPGPVVMALAAQPNVEVIAMDERGDHRGMLWRFLAAADET